MAPFFHPFLPPPYTHSQNSQNAHVHTCFHSHITSAQPRTHNLTHTHMHTQPYTHSHAHTHIDIDNVPMYVHMYVCMYMCSLVRVWCSTGGLHGSSCHFHQPLPRPHLRESVVFCHPPSPDQLLLEVELPYTGGHFVPAASACRLWVGVSYSAGECLLHAGQHVPILLGHDNHRIPYLYPDHFCP